MKILIILGLMNLVDMMAQETEMKKVLVVYYSRSGNTKKVAQYIKEAVNGDIFEIIPEQDYPSDYQTVTKQAKKEINEGYLPPIKSKADISKYDIIFIGSPCWWSSIAPPVATFLKEHDLSKKTVIPFSTHGGSGLANNARDTAKLAPNSLVLEGKAFKGNEVDSNKSEIINWAKSITTNL